MDFRKTYTLIESIPGEGANSFRGRQLASGRDVTIHLLPGGSLANETSLARIRTLPAESLSQVIEVGENDGTLYLVTAAPPFQHFSEWLPNQERVSSGVADLEPASGAGLVPGEFTRFFQVNSSGPQDSSEPAMPPSPKGVGPGEFTRLMGPALPLAKQTPDARAMESSPVTPGGFTRIIRVSGDSPAMAGAESGPEATDAFTISASQLKPPKAEEGPSEYTRVIAGPLPPQTAQASPTAISQVVSAAREPSEAQRPKGPQLSVFLTAILCLLSFLAGGALVLLILRS
jgi:hypothetical protein